MQARCASSRLARPVLESLPEAGTRRVLGPLHDVVLFGNTLRPAGELRRGTQPAFTAPAAAVAGRLRQAGRHLQRLDLPAGRGRQFAVVDRRGEFALAMRQRLVAAEHHHAVRGDDEVAGLERRIVHHVHRRDAHGAGGVAGAARTDLRAIRIGVLERGIGGPVLGAGGVDAGLAVIGGEHLGRRSRTEAVAALDRHLVAGGRHAGQRKIAPVAGAHAIDDARPPPLVRGRRGVTVMESPSRSGIAGA